MPKLDRNIAVNFAGWTLFPGISIYDSESSGTSWTAGVASMLGASSAGIIVDMDTGDEGQQQIKLCRTRRFLR
jgi:hypothetical protein